MIRCVARYAIAVDDFEAVDAFGDRLMGALTLDADVLEPDLAVSMTERTLEILLLVDTNDPLAAVERANRAIQAAFRVADHPPVAMKALMHRDLLGARTELHTELVNA